MKKNQLINFRSNVSKFTGEGKFIDKFGVKGIIVELTKDFKEHKKGQNIIVGIDEVIEDSKVEKQSKYIDESSIILQFKDDAEIIHEVALTSILQGGIPIDEESEEEMVLIGTYVLDA